MIAASFEIRRGMPKDGAAVDESCLAVVQGLCLMFCPPFGPSSAGLASFSALKLPSEVSRQE